MGDSPWVKIANFRIDTLGSTGACKKRRLPILLLIMEQMSCSCSSCCLCSVKSGIWSWATSWL